MSFSGVELPNAPRLYRISGGMAKRKAIPVYFIGQALIQTQKAAYFYGRGTLELQKKGVCFSCGRELTHPVSISLGIGPECGKHYWNWDLIGGFENKEAVKEALKIKIPAVKFDEWLPKSCITEMLPTDEYLHIPRRIKVKLNIGKKKEEGKKESGKKAEILPNGRIKITFPYDPEEVRKVKSIPGRKWHPDDRNDLHWSIPRTLDAIKSLKEWGYQIDQKLLDWFDRVEGAEVIVPDIKVDAPTGCYPFQTDGIKFLTWKRGRGLIADEMGLGKTIQALGYIHANPKRGLPAVIVCPASLKSNWERETRKWLPNLSGNIMIGYGKKGQKIPSHIQVLIINYDILAGWFESIRKWEPRLLITDEAHYMKNMATIRTKQVKKLSRITKGFIALTGTPIESKPIEFYSVISMLDPDLFPNKMAFAQKYCGATYGPFGWDFSGAANQEELHKLLTSTIMLRRRKDDVLKDLPPKSRAVIPIPIDNRKEYNRALNDFIDWVKQTKGADAAARASDAESLAKIEALKQVAIKGKMKACLSWINDFLETGEKLILFCTHKSTVKVLMELFQGIAVKVDGSVSMKKRQEAVDSFQNDPEIKLFVGNIKAAGVGLTLTAASNVGFLELGWTPKLHDQAEDRAHRIGQKASSINIWYLLAENTIEMEIAELLDYKRGIVDSVIDGIESEESSLLIELMKKYKGEG